MKGFKIVGFVIGILFVFMGISHSADIKLTWTHPTPEIVDSYLLYVGVAPGAYSDPTVIEGGDTFTHNITLAPQNWTMFYFALKARNAFGDSGFSEEIKGLAGPNPDDLCVDIAEPPGTLALGVVGE